MAEKTVYMLCMAQLKHLVYMDKSFYYRVFERQEEVKALPSNQVIAQWALDLLSLLYPERSVHAHFSLSEIEIAFGNLEDRLINLLKATEACENCQKEEVAAGFFGQIPEMYRKMNSDVEALLYGDPAANSTFEVIRAYPGFFAIAIYRIAHTLQLLGVPLIPRILTEYAHSLTGIDIHPGAHIGDYFFIDHGTGIVIGESTSIGNYVKLYQGVTLGALSVEKDMVNTKRHPTIEDHVIIYSGATILGGDTVVGSYSVIGGNVWLTSSVPAKSRVYHRPAIKVIESKEL